jgi:cell division protein FtsI (penicillin-binding protein 3)
MFVKRRISPDEATQVEKLHLEGVHFEREYRRYYPAGETAAHVVGITNVDDQGQEGAELAFDDALKSVQGRKLVLKNGSKESIKDVEYVTAPRFGKDLALSLDLRLQFFSYRELKSAIEEHHAKSGSVVMLDAHTGEILALVNEPSFNPNEMTRVAPDARRNRAITDLFEPGSTVKPLTVRRWNQGAHEGSIIDTTGIHACRSAAGEGSGQSRTPVAGGATFARSSGSVSRRSMALDDRMVFVFVRAGLSEMTSCGLP